jgi:hypothetical protein
MSGREAVIVLARGLESAGLVDSRGARPVSRELKKAEKVKVSAQKADELYKMTNSCGSLERKLQTLRPDQKDETIQVLRKLVAAREAREYFYRGLLDVETAERRAK